MSDPKTPTKARDTRAGASPARRRLLPNLLLVLVTVLVMLLFFEGAFRILGLRGYHESRYRDWENALLPDGERIPGIHLQLRPDSRFSFQYESDPRGYFDEGNRMVFHTNSWGLRGDDFAAEKAEGVQRVLVLGDSFTFGEGVRLEDTFCVRLEGLLKERLGREVEVLNLGVSAWSTVEEIEYLQQVGLGFEPDLVLVVFVANDATYAAGLDFFDNFRERYENPALKHSYFISWVYAKLAKRLSGRNYIEFLVGEALRREQQWQDAFDALTEGKQLAAGRGSKFAVALFPFMYELHDDYPLKPIHDEVAGHCAEQGIPVLDLLEAFKGREYGELWVHPADQHPNEVGHGIAAEAMAGFIAGQELLPRP